MGVRNIKFLLKQLKRMVETNNITNRLIIPCNTSWEDSGVKKELCENLTDEKIESVVEEEEERRRREEKQKKEREEQEREGQEGWKDGDDLMEKIDKQAEKIDKQANEILMAMKKMEEIRGELRKVFTI